MCAIAQTGSPTPRMLDVLVACGPPCDSVLIPRAQVHTSPIYDAKSPVHRDYEHRLHEAYDRTGYWG